MKSKKSEIDIIEYRTMCRLRGYGARRISHRFNNRELDRLNRIKRTIFEQQAKELDANKIKRIKKVSENS